MWRFVLRRGVSALFVLFGASILTYCLLFVTPGDPAETILRQQMGGRTPSRVAVEQFRVAKGLNDPIPIQYASWMWDVLHGDLGQSYYHGTSVSRMILRRVVPTVELAVAGMAVSLTIAVPTGVLSAVHKGQLPDLVGQLGALLGVSMPNFWLGYLLIIVFPLHLGVFQTSGVGGIEHLVLPALTLGTGMAAIVTRLIRSSMLEVLSEDYVWTARSKGLRERIVVYKHALRNALIPVVTVVGLQLGYLLNGAVVIEMVFQRPGLGNLLINAIFARDYPVVQGIVLVVAVVFVVTNFAVDIAYRFIDPRISIGGTER